MTTLLAVAEPTFWQGLFKIIIADILLAGDNAIVIALAVRSLPPKQQWWGRMIGSFGAVALRVLFVFIISWLLSIPFLKLIGGLLLIWIAIKLLTQSTEVEGHGEVKEAGSLGQAIWLIMVADVVMSLDNVIAISAASGGHFELVIIGLLISIPLVVFGSSLLSNLMQKLPWIIWLGAGLLGFVAGEMILSDPKLKGFIEPWSAIAHNLPLALFVFITLLGWWLAQKTARAKQPLVAVMAERHD